MTREEAIKKLESLKISLPAAKDEISEIVKLIDSPWISVKDDLPCNHKELIYIDEFTGDSITKPVYVIRESGYHDTDFMVKSANKWEWNTDIKWDYWFPIPKPPKE